MRNIFLFIGSLIILIICIFLLEKNLIFSIAILLFFSLIFFLLYDPKIWVFYFLLLIPLINQLLLIFFGFSSTFLSIGFFVAILFFAIINRSYYDKSIRLKLDTFKLLLFSLILYIALSILLISSDKSYGINKYIYFISSIIMLFLPSYVFKKKNDLKSIVAALIFLGLIYAIASNLQYFEFFRNPLRLSSIRFHLFSLNPIFFARDISYSIIAILYLFVHYSNNINENIGKLFLLLVTLFSLSFFMALTGSKGPILALFITMIICFLVFQKSTKSSTKVTSIGMLLILILLSVIVFYLLPDTIIARLSNVDIDNQKTSIVRLLAMMEGLKNFAQNVIFGLGFGSYKFETVIFGELVYPHNIFIEFLSETGLIGFAIFVSFLILTFRMLKQLYIRIELQNYLFLLSLFLTSLINANFSGHVGYNMMFWFSCGLIYSIYKLSDEK